MSSRHTTFTSKGQYLQRKKQAACWHGSGARGQTVLAVALALVARYFPPGRFPLTSSQIIVFDRVFSHLGHTWRMKNLGALIPR